MRRHLDYKSALSALLEGHCRSVLDVGSGKWSPLEECATDPQFRVAVDIHEPYLRAQRARGWYTHCVQGDARSISSLFTPASFDTVVALDIIEHLEKGQSIELVNSLERLARELIIVFTPNGFVPQRSKDSNDHQVHLCGWSTTEFMDRGYTVYGIDGLKFLRKEASELRFRPKRLFGPLSMFTQRFCFTRPKYAFHLLAVKYL